MKLFDLFFALVFIFWFAERIEEIYLLMIFDYFIYIVLKILIYSALRIFGKLSILEKGKLIQRNLLCYAMFRK
jgi:hypothetical protein